LPSDSSRADCLEHIGQEGKRPGRTKRRGKLKFVKKVDGRVTKGGGVIGNSQ